MSREEQQKKLLAGLLVVLLVAVGYRWIQSSSEGGGGRRSRASSAQETLAAIEMPHLDLELLKLEAAEYSPGRDPFRFGAAPKPKAPPPEPIVVKRPIERKKPTPRPAARPPQPPKPRPPQVGFTYLGSFGPQDRRLAVFTEGGEIYNAFVGDILMGKFIVDKIGFESADIKFVGFPNVPETRLVAGG